MLQFLCSNYVILYSLYSTLLSYFDFVVRIVRDISFLASRRRDTRFALVSWERRGVEETDKDKADGDGRRQTGADMDYNIE